jgi:predicted phosphodiesterase
MLKLAVVGDSHTPTGDAAYTQIVESIAAANPDVVVHVGDYSDHGSIREAKRFLALSAPIRDKLLVVRGNHDSRGLGFLTHRFIIGRGDYYVDFPDTRIVVVNTSFRKRGISNRRMRAVEYLVSQRNSIVFCHIPPQSARFPRGFVRNAKRFIEVLGKHNAILVTGHHHLLETSYLPPHALQYFVTGGGGGPLHSGEAYHWLLFTVDKTSINVKAVRLGDKP